MLRLWVILCTLVGTLLVAGALVLLAVPSTRTIPAEILFRQEEPIRGEDAIVLLMGDAVDRVPHAAALYKKGMGKKIVFVEPEMTKLMELGLRPMEGQMVYDYLTKNLKVPPDDIIFNKKTRVSSTQEEAQELYKIMDKQGFHRVILATSWYHSSRAMWVFGRVAKGRAEKLISVPTPIPAKWYRSEVDFLCVFNEYLKWVHNGLKYGVFN